MWIHIWLFFAVQLFTSFAVIASEASFPDPTETLGDCMNHKRECDQWAAAGLCTTWPSMRHNCKLSCNLCTENHVDSYNEQEAPVECEDSADDCADRYENGECNENHEVMETDCPKTCAFCSGHTNNQASVGLNDFDDVNEVSCEDNNDNCQMWFEDGRCETNGAYMQQECARSCNFCGIQQSDTDANSQDLQEVQQREPQEVQDECRDENIHCESWARDDRCSSAYVKLHCSRSCNSCNDDGAARLADLQMLGPHGDVLNLPAPERMADVTNQTQFSVVENSKLWPGETVPYTFHNALVDPDAVRRAMRIIQQNSCVKFKECPSCRDAVLIRSDRSRCYSSDLGKNDTGHQEMNLGPGCWVEGIILHELLHVLGFYHEQSRPDRNDYLRVVYSNINTSWWGQFEIYHGRLQALGHFDYGSVMMYPAKHPDIALDPSRPFMVPTKDRSAISRMGNRVSMTAEDIRKLRIAYCEDSTTTTTRRPLTTTRPATPRPTPRLPHPFTPRPTRRVPFPFTPRPPFPRPIFIRRNFRGRRVHRRCSVINNVERCIEYRYN